jgi:hypothetical protein
MELMRPRLLIDSADRSALERSSGRKAMTGDVVIPRETVSRD